MPLAHAVAWIDHHKAHVLQFDANQVLDEKIHEQSHYTRQHGSAVRSEHEFFGEVCDALAGIEAVLVVGGHTAQADFRHYVDKHRPHLAPLIVGWETVDNPTEGQVVKLARQFFVRRCEMVPTHERIKRQITLAISGDFLKSRKLGAIQQKPPNKVVILRPQMIFQNPEPERRLQL